MNFGELKANLLEVIGRAPADICYTLTTADVNHRLRISEMEATATIPAINGTIFVPGGLLSVRSIKDADGCELEPSTLATFERFRGEGRSRFYAINGTSFVFNVTPDYIDLTYYEALLELEDDDDTNNVLGNHPSVFVYGVLAHHNALIQSDKAGMYYAAFEQAMKQAQGSDTRKKTAGLPHTPRVGSTP